MVLQPDLQIIPIMQLSMPRDAAVAWPVARLPLSRSAHSVSPLPSVFLARIRHLQLTMNSHFRDNALCFLGLQAYRLFRSRFLHVKPVHREAGEKVITAISRSFRWKIRHVLSEKFIGAIEILDCTFHPRGVTTLRELFYGAYLRLGQPQRTKA